MSTSHAWVNGWLIPTEQPELAVTDRGFLLGDGVFETIRICSGRALELPLHLGRLRSSAEKMEIPLPGDLEVRLGDAITEVIGANGLDGAAMTAAVRLTVSRGPVAGRALLPPTGVAPTLVVQAWRVDPPPPELLRRGLHLVISTVRRDPMSPLAAVKTTSRADFVYARLEAHRRAADDALFLTTDGHVAEATSASIFMLDSAGIATPSLECGILRGTTREWVIRSGALALGVSVREIQLAPEELRSASEVLLASSVAGILPVTRIDGWPVGDGQPGPLSHRLREAREAAITAAAATLAELPPGP